MRRVVALIAVALASAIAVAASGAAGDTKGPPCVNITTGDFGYVVNPDGTGTVQGFETLAAGACATATYTFYVLDTSGNVLATQTVEGATVAGSTTISFDVTFAGPAPDTVCVYGTALFRGRLADRAPDSGCLAIDLSSSGATGYH
jgi:hypothetical protein